MSQNLKILRATVSSFNGVSTPAWQLSRALDDAMKVIDSIERDHDELRGKWHEVVKSWGEE